MANLVAAGAKAVRRMLESACARNTSAELHCEGDEGRLTAHMRLLAIESHHLITDEAQFVGSGTVLRQRQPVMIHFLYDGVRWAFRTQVSRPLLLVTLNEELRVRGMALQLPDQITEQQRRAEFRLSLAARDSVADLHTTAPGDVTVCPLDAELFEGRLTNISVGGLCLLVSRQCRKSFFLGELFYACFRLPDLDQECVLPVEVRNHRRVAESGATLVGVRFVACDPAHTSAQLNLIQRFVAVEQRRLLRARKV